MSSRLTSGSALSPPAGENSLSKSESASSLSSAEPTDEQDSLCFHAHPFNVPQHPDRVRSLTPPRLSMSDHSATTLSGSPSKQQPAAAVSPVDEKAAASPQGHHPATPAYPTGEKAAVDNATRSPPAPPMQSLPTLKDIHSNPRDLEARRVRSRALSQSTVPGDVSLGRALSRVISPCVSSFS